MSTSKSITFIDPQDVKTIRSPCELLLNAFLKKFVVPLYLHAGAVRIEMKYWKIKWENHLTQNLHDEFDSVINDLRFFNKINNDIIYKNIRNTFTEYRPHWNFPKPSIFFIDWLVRVSQYSTCDAEKWSEEVLLPYVTSDKRAEVFFDCANMFLKGILENGKEICSEILEQLNCQNPYMVPTRTISKS